MKCISFMLLEDDNNDGKITDIAAKSYSIM